MKLPREESSRERTQVSELRRESSKERELKKKLKRGRSEEPCPVGACYDVTNVIKLKSFWASLLFRYMMFF